MKISTGQKCQLNSQNLSFWAVALKGHMTYGTTHGRSDSAFLFLHFFVSSFLCFSIPQQNPLKPPSTASQTFWQVLSEFLAGLLETLACLSALLASHPDPPAGLRPSSWLSEPLTSFSDNVGCLLASLTGRHWSLWDRFPISTTYKFFLNNGSSRTAGTITFERLLSYIK